MLSGKRLLGIAGIFVVIALGALVYHLISLSATRGDGRPSPSPSAMVAVDRPKSDTVPSAHQTPIVSIDLPTWLRVNYIDELRKEGLDVKLPPRIYIETTSGIPTSEVGDLAAKLRAKGFEVHYENIGGGVINTTKVSYYAKYPDDEKAARQLIEFLNGLQIPHLQQTPEVIARAYDVRPGHFDILLGPLR